MGKIIKHFILIINEHSKPLLLLSVLFLAMWGMFVLSDSFCLYYNYNGGYSNFERLPFFRSQLTALFTGMAVFFIIQKWRTVENGINPKIILALTAFTIFSLYTISPVSFEYLRNFKYYIKGGALINLMLIFYCYLKIKTGEAFSKRELSGYAAVCVFAFIMLLAYNDLLAANACIFSAIVFFAMTGRKRLAAELMFLLAAGYIFMYLSYPNFAFRINNFLFSGKHGFQVSQSLRAIKTGGFWGIGPAGAYFSSVETPLSALKGISAPSFIPDFCGGFIFAVFAMEYGFWGVALYSFIIVFIVCLAVMAILRAESKGAAFMLILFTLLFIQMEFIGMATPFALIPPNGEGLPLFSYGFGGSAFVFVYAALIYRNLGFKNVRKESVFINAGYFIWGAALLFSIVPLAFFCRILGW
jgi:cell division protein FtsW (lipid II flippase)